MRAYGAILATAAEKDHPHAPFRTILEHLASPTPPSPLLVHCTAGKDSMYSACHIRLAPQRPAGWDTAQSAYVSTPPQPALIRLPPTTRHPPPPCAAHPAKTHSQTGTGVFIALVLALCGLDDAVIAHEYSLTDLGLASRKPEIVEHLIQGEALFGDRARAERMVSAR